MYILNQKLKTIKCPREKLNFFLKYEKDKKNLIANLNNLNNYILNKYPTYNKDNRDEIKLISDFYILFFKDYISYMIKNSKKKDLVATLIKANERIIENNLKFFNESSKLKSQLILNVEQFEKRQIGKLILDKIYYQKDNYIRSFDSISEGVRDWDCLVDLIEDGTIGLTELPSYGIEVNDIKLD